MKDGFVKTEKGMKSLRLMSSVGAAVVFELVNSGRTLELRYENLGDGSIKVLKDFLKITDAKNGHTSRICVLVRVPQVCTESSADF